MNGIQAIYFHRCWIQAIYFHRCCKTKLSDSSFNLCGISKKQLYVPKTKYPSKNWAPFEATSCNIFFGEDILTYQYDDPCQWWKATANKILICAPIFMLLNKNCVLTANQIYKVISLNAYPFSRNSHCF